MHTRIPQWVFSLPFLVLLACGQQSEIQGLGEPCTSDGQCGAGQACLLIREDGAGTSGFGYAEETTDSVVQTCQIPCFRDAECPSGFVCEGEALSLDEQEGGSSICIDNNP